MTVWVLTETNNMSGQDTGQVEVSARAFRDRLGAMAALAERHEELRRRVGVVDEISYGTSAYIVYDDGETINLECHEAELEE